MIIYVYCLYGSRQSNHEVHAYHVNANSDGLAFVPAVQSWDPESGGSAI